MSDVAIPNNTDVDGTAYKRCCAWSHIAGCNYACFEMCSEEQRDACTKQQCLDKGEKPE
jgi:hypothetical protein